MTALFFLIVTAATLAALALSGLELFRGGGEDPLAARLEELPAHAMATAARQSVRRGGLLTADEIGQKFLTCAVTRNTANPKF